MSDNLSPRFALIGGCTGGVAVDASHPVRLSSVELFFCCGIITALPRNGKYLRYVNSYSYLIIKYVLGIRKPVVAIGYESVIHVKKLHIFTYLCTIQCFILLRERYTRCRSQLLQNQLRTHTVLVFPVCLPAEILIQ